MTDESPATPQGSSGDPVDQAKTTRDKVSAAVKPALEKTKAAAGDASGKVKAEAAKLKDQAADKAREFATGGKEKATGVLDEFAKLIDDAANRVDEKLGEQYGGYARSAADAVAGFASQLRGKDVDQLFDDARDFVKKSPAVAIGTAAALGFVLARLVKAGLSDETPPSSSAGDDSPPTV